MTPPDTNLKKQERRHRGPLIGMALVVILGVGIIVYWVGEEVAQAPAPEGETEEVTPAEIREGDVDPQPSAPTETLEPEDPEVEIQQ